MTREFKKKPFEAGPEFAVKGAFYVMLLRYTNYQKGQEH